MNEDDKWVKYQCSVCSAIMRNKPNLEMKCSFPEGGKTCKGKYYPIGFYEQNVPKETIDLLRNPNLFNLFVKEQDKYSVGEIETKENLTLTILGGRLISNAEATSYNSFLAGVSGTGKDRQAQGICKLLGKGLNSHFSRISPRVLDYLHSEEKEPEFSWDGKILYLEDISQPVLNGETLRVMASGGNHTIVIRDGFPIEMKINGKPILLVTSAQSYLDEDMRRRFVSFEIDSSEKQTLAIQEFKSKIAKEGLKEFNEQIINCSYCLSRVEVVVPFADEILKGFPKTILARTGSSRVIDFVKAVAGIYQFQRKRNSKDEVIAEAKDYEIARRVFLNIFGKQQTLEPLTPNHKIILECLKETKIEATASKIHEIQGKNLFSQIKGTWKCLGSLVKKGLLNSKVESGLEYYSYKTQETLLLIEPSELEVNRVSEVTKQEVLTSLTKVTNENLSSFNPEEAFK